MTINQNSTPSSRTDRHASRPSPGLLRHGLRWTVAVCTVGATVGLATAASASEADSHSSGYAACVNSLGGMPDAVNQHIDPCSAVDTAIGARRAVYLRAVDGR
jgi:hypothetical protein